MKIKKEDLLMGDGKITFDFMIVYKDEPIEDEEDDEKEFLIKITPATEESYNGGTERLLDEERFDKTRKALDELIERSKKNEK